MSTNPPHASPRVQDAVSVVRLLHMAHPHCQSAQEASRQGAAGLDLLKVRSHQPVWH